MSNAKDGLVDDQARAFDIRLLGGLVVHLDGHPVRFRYRKSAALLAYLVSERRAHQRSSLAGLLWSDFPESRALANLRSSLADLSARLGPWIAVEGDLVRFGTDQPYRLDTERLRAAAGLDDGTGHADDGAGVRRYLDGDDAVASVAGAFLAGFTVEGAPLFEEWVVAEAERYRLLAVSVLGRLSLEEAHLGHWERAIDLASRVVTLDPFSQRSLRRVHELRELAEHDLARSSGFRGSTVPIPPTEIIGRSSEIARVRKMVNGGSRLVTITGPGGVGKTRLALAVAAALSQQFLNGVSFVDLALVSRDDLVSSEIAAAVGAPSAFGDESIDWLAAALAPLQLLLVLDNCEHLRSVASIAGQLLERCAGLTVVATSRAPLKLRAEELLPLSGLPVESDDEGSPASELFLARARATGTGLVETRSERIAIDTLCRLFNGMPLAIELVAARTRTTPPSALLDAVERGSQSLIDLGGPAAADAPDRHQSVRSAIASSYEALSGNAQELLRALSVCVDPPDVATIAAVAGKHELDVDSLTALVDASLLEPTTDKAGRARYRLLETVRSFAAETLVKSGAEVAVRGRHARYLYELALVETGMDEVESSTSLSERGRDWPHSSSRAFHECAADFSAALDFAAQLGDPTLLAQLVGSGSIRVFAEIVASRVGLISTIEQALAADALDGPTRALVLCGLGYITGMRRETRSAVEYFEQAGAFYRAVGNKNGEASALFYTGMARLTNPGDPTEVAQARAPMEASLVMARAAGSHRIAAEALNALAMMAINEGRIDEGEALLAAGALEIGDQAPPLYKALDPLRLGTLDLARGRRQESLEKLADAIGMLAENRCFLLTAAYCVVLTANNLATDPAGTRLREAAQLVGAHTELERRLGIIATSPEENSVAPGSTSPVLGAYKALRDRIDPDALEAELRIGSSWSMPEIVDAIKLIALS